MNQQQAISVPAPEALRYATVPRLIEALERLNQVVAERFVPLNDEQLNWKPTPDEWSVGQCLDHIITTDKQYVPIFEQAVQGAMRGNFWQRLPLMPRLFGDLLYKYTHPQTTKPMPAPRIFRPSSSHIEPDVCARFQAHQEQMLGFLHASQDKPIDKLVISSPVATWMVYSLGDAFRILTVHQYLHLLQAEGVKHTAGFPIAGQVA